MPALCTASGDAALLEQERTLSALSGKKIVNLTGISNTDLKLIYGTSNLAFLIECDQNFTLLARTLQTCAARFYELGNRHTAVIFLEFAVSCKSDISKTYSLLSKIYEENGEPEKIHTLLEAAGQLNSLMKPSIIRHLESAI